jgi:DNA-binding transcriptional regulator YdaS (Cro superfamily)
MDKASARRHRLRQLLDREPYLGRGGQARLAADIKRAPAQISQWLGGARTLNEESARNIEEMLKLPFLWMDGAPDTAWPFSRITPQQWADLSAEERLKAEAVVQLLLDMEGRSRSSLVYPIPDASERATYSVHEPSPGELALRRGPADDHR